MDLDPQPLFTLCDICAGLKASMAGLRILIRDPVLFYPLDPGYRYRMNFFRITNPDPFIDENYLQSMLFYLY
jgi:hypothetical protein